jgi:hypothetical protein
MANDEENQDSPQETKESPPEKLELLPDLNSDEMKNIYFFYGAIYFLVNYYFYSTGQYWFMIFFNAGLFLYYVRNKEVGMVMDSKATFQELEEQMKELIGDHWGVDNFLYVDPWCINFFTSCIIYRNTDPKGFNQCLLRVNTFLRYVEMAKTGADIEKMGLLRKEAMNCFHTILYSQINRFEVERHNYLRYLLEERLNKLFVDTMNRTSHGTPLNEFGYNKYFNSHYDIY